MKHCPFCGVIPTINPDSADMLQHPQHPECVMSGRLIKAHGWDHRYPDPPPDPLQVSRVDEQEVEDALQDAVGDGEGYLHAKYVFRALDHRGLSIVRSAAWNRRAPSVAERWRPIESAPKDSSEIIVYFAGWTTGISAYWDLHMRQWESGSADVCGEVATHWQPLPSPPTSGTCLE